MKRKKKSLLTLLWLHHGPRDMDQVYRSTVLFVQHGQLLRCAFLSIWKTVPSAVRILCLSRKSSCRAPKSYHMLYKLTIGVLNSSTYFRYLSCTLLLSWLLNSQTMPRIWSWQTDIWDIPTNPDKNTPLSPKPTVLNKSSLINQTFMADTVIPTTSKCTHMIKI